MADFDALDELLSGSLKRAAQPGDSAGVADTIRARVAAGDVGTPAPSSGPAPGFGGGLAGWLPWVGAIVVLGLVGGTLGATGAFGRPDAPAPVSNNVLISLSDSGVGASPCPAGAPITELQPGQHVVALARSADSADVEVRDPAALDQTVWVTAKALKSLGKDFSTLPVSGCGVLTSTPVPAPVVVTPVTPVAPPTKPGKPAPDTTPPVVGAITVDTTDACKPIVTVQITDNVGVSSATLKGTSGSPYNVNQTVVMTHPGGTSWKGTLNMPSNFSGIVNLTITAHDAAGNTTTTTSKFTDPPCPIG
jgi:hypothetical protein